MNIRAYGSSLEMSDEPYLSPIEQYSLIKSESLILLGLPLSQLPFSQ